MLEVLLLLFLCHKNKANALSRGRRPGSFIGWTIGLWLGMEFLGSLIGRRTGSGFGVYAAALLFGLFGGLASYLIAKHCKPGNYLTPAAQMSRMFTAAAPLSQPARLDLIREKAAAGAVLKWTFFLNGQPVGTLENGGALTVHTWQRQNILFARDSYGGETPPYPFDMTEGGFGQIIFKAGRFQPERFAGVLPPTALPATAARIPASAPPSKPEMAAFCHRCGEPFPAGDAACRRCGTTRFSLPQTPPAPLPQPPEEALFQPAVVVVVAPPGMEVASAAGGTAFSTSSPPHRPAAALELRGKERPNRLLILLGSAFALVLVISLIPWPPIFRGTYSRSIYLLYTVDALAYGICAVFLRKKDLGSKLWGGGGLLLAGLLYTVSFVRMMNIIPGRSPELGEIFGAGAFLPVLWGQMRFIIAFAVFILGMDILRRRQPLSQGMAALFAGVSCLLAYRVSEYRMILGLFRGMGLGSIHWFSILRQLLTAGAVIAVFLFAEWFSRLTDEPLASSTGAKIWIGLVIAGVSVSTVANLTTQRDLLTVVVSAVAVTGLILILLGKRMGFPIYLVGVGTLCFFHLLLLLDALFYPHVQVFSAMLALLGSAANPAITWLFLTKRWSTAKGSAGHGYPAGEPSPPPAAGKQVHLVYKIAAILDTAVGGVLFAAGAGTILMDEFMTEPFVFGVLLGGAVAALGVAGIVQGFRPRIPARKWALIPALIVAALAVGLVLFAVVINLS